MSKANCIDISTWNKNVNFNKVKAAGIEVVIIRAGFGREISQKDNEFETHYKNAKAAGLKIGAYWYSYADSIADAEKEAKACLSCVSGKSFDLPIYYDLEESSIAALGKATCTAIAIKFCDTLKAAGYRAGVYTNANWFNNYLNYSTLATKCSIWLAQWASSHSLKCDIWQYGDDGRIDGINGNVDVNIIENKSIINGSATPSGQSDISVKVVQVWLNKIYNLKLATDGIYGPATKKAIIIGLQRVLNQKFKANLVVDGIFGPKTKAAIQPLKKGATGGYPSILQAFLICEGYDTGGFDGDFGSKTENTVKQYQREHNLVVDGIAGKETFAKLAE